MAFAGLVVARLHVEAHVARARIERDEVHVRGAPVDRVAVNRHAARAWISLGRGDVVGEPARVNPLDFAGRHVERDHSAAALGHVHQAVRDDRRRDPTAVVAHGVAPHGTQLGDVAAIDLPQRAEAFDVVGAPIAEPVARLRIQQTLVGDRLPVVELGRRHHARRRDCRRHAKNCGEPIHYPCRVLDHSSGSHRSATRSPASAASLAGFGDAVLPRRARRASMYPSPSSKP